MLHHSLYSEKNLFDPVSRRNKAYKVLAVLSDYLSIPLTQLTCLEIGCAAGMMTKYFAQAFRWVVGIDLNLDAVRFAFHNNSDRARFIIADGAYLPFPDESYDVIICTQVYEHSQNPAGIVNEIWRVLREGGVCFFSGPNKLSLIEGHTGLPLVQWLPKRFAKWLVRLLKRGVNFEINLMTYWELKQLFHRFEIVDYTPILIKDPLRFSLGDQIPFRPLVSHVPSVIYRWLAFAIPNFNWVLRKPRKGL
ncbi:MAG: class I SAM-dependent methyltransferase [Candidatus Methanomethyliaceae archaeon]